MKVYENGNMYEGYLKNGKRNGYGKFYFNHGGEYEGNWVENKMQGQGILYYPSGKIAYEGQFF